MLYHLFDYLQQFDVPGARLFEYLTFRSGMALILSILIATIVGRHIIDRLQMMQVGEIVRNLGLEGQMSKTGTPTMGGVIIIIAIIVPCLLRGDFKIVGQVGVGLMVGLTMYLSPDIVVRENIETQNAANHQIEVTYKSQEEKQPITTIPFVKGNNMNYAWFTKWMGDNAETGGWILFVLVTIFVVAAVSNGANLTDGIDGLCSSVTVTFGISMCIIAYMHKFFGVSLMASVLVGGCIGFLVWNHNPAKVFMGDTGSMFLGGMVVAIAYALNCPLILLLTGIIYVIEGASDVLQIGYFKITHGKRIFKMATIHHHFEMSGWSEKKIVAVFSIVNAVGGAAAIALMYFGGYAI